MLIAIVDCGIGNLYSVKQALTHAISGNPNIVITDDVAVVRDADKVVFPGQGAAKDCMAGITRKGLLEPLKQAASEKPFLGICLGLQVLFDHSEENGGTKCLGSVTRTGKASEYTVIPWAKQIQNSAHGLEQCQTNRRASVMESHR